MNREEKKWEREQNDSLEKNSTVRRLHSRRSRCQTPSLPRCRWWYPNGWRWTKKASGPVSPVPRGSTDPLIHVRRPSARHGSHRVLHDVGPLGCPETFESWGGGTVISDSKVSESNVSKPSCDDTCTVSYQSLQWSIISKTSTLISLIKWLRIVSKSVRHFADVWTFSLFTSSSWNLVRASEQVSNFSFHMIFELLKTTKPDSQKLAKFAKLWSMINCYDVPNLVPINNHRLFACHSASLFAPTELWCTSALTTGGAGAGAMPRCFWSVPDVEAATTGRIPGEYNANTDKQTRTQKRRRRGWEAAIQRVCVSVSAVECPVPARERRPRIPRFSISPLSRFSFSPALSPLCSFQHISARLRLGSLAPCPVAWFLPIIIAHHHKRHLLPSCHPAENHLYGELFQSIIEKYEKTNQKAERIQKSKLIENQSNLSCSKHSFRCIFLKNIDQNTKIHFFSNEKQPKVANLSCVRVNRRTFYLRWARTRCTLFPFLLSLRVFRFEICDKKCGTRCFWAGDAVRFGWTEDSFCESSSSSVLLYLSQYQNPLTVHIANINPIQISVFRCLFTCISCKIRQSARSLLPRVSTTVCTNTYSSKNYFDIYVADAFLSLLLSKEEKNAFEYWNIASLCFPVNEPWPFAGTARTRTAQRQWGTGPFLCFSCASWVFFVHFFSFKILYFQVLFFYIFYVYQAQGAALAQATEEVRQLSSQLSLTKGKLVGSLADLETSSSDKKTLTSQLDDITKKNDECMTSLRNTKLRVDGLEKDTKTNADNYSWVCSVHF